MGVKLQLLLGLLLFGSVCGSEDNSTNFQNVLSEKIDSTNNAIEKQPKTDSQINLVNKDTQNNPEDNIKNSNQPIENDTHKNQTSSQEELGNNDSSSSNENDKGRQDNSRSINVDKLTSPDFHNNDYSLMRQKFLENIIRKSSTKGYMDFSNFQLTTPKTDYFEEEKQKLEDEYEPEHFTNHHIDDEEHTDEDDHEHLHHDLHMDRLFGETKRTPNSTIDYKEKTKISRNNTLGDNSEHNELTIEKFQNFKFASEYNVTTSDEDDNSKPEMLSPRENIETTTFKDFRTTRKPVTLTKPPTEHNYHILSNNIESETIKAINSLTTEFSTTKRLKGENEIMPKEQTVEENKISREEVTNPLNTETIVNFNNTNSTTEQNNTSTQKYEENTETNVNIINSTTTEHYEQSTTNNKLPLLFETTTNTTEYDTNETTTTYLETIVKTNTESNTTVKEETTTTIKPDYSTDLYTDNKGSTIELNKTETSTSLTTDQIETTTSTISPIQETTTDTKGTTTKELNTTELTTTDLPTSDITTTELTTTEFIQNLTTTSDATESTTTFKENLTETTLTTESGTRISKAFSFDDTSTVTTEFSEKTTEAITEKYSSTTDADTSKPTEELTSVKNTTEVFTTTEMKTEVETTTQTISTTKIIEEDTTVSPATTTTTTVIIDNSPTFKYIHTKSYANTSTTTSSIVTQPVTNYPKFRNASAATEETTVTATLSTEELTSDSSQAPDAGNVGGVEDNKGKIAAIVISTVGAVSLILLAGLLYIMRKRQKRFNYKQRCRPVSLDHYSMDNVSGYNSTRRKAERQSKRSYGNPAFDDPAAVTHPLNFPALAKFATNPEEMKAEFEEVPQINANLSELPDGCETKNRYANVIPLPETRVFLQQIEGYPNSDYINANYVTGPKNTKGYYIACQGPMQNTVDDFWRMVWEQQTKVILMITHLFENGVEKCIDYLPPSEVLDCNRLFGDFQVTLKKRDIKDKYIISDLQLKNMVSNSWREVTHFWYLGWPEKGVPTEENSLIAFLIEARSYMKSATLDKTTAANGNTNAPPKIEINPVVVHCSPGTGRTGVVIACDIAIREFEQTRLVDIPKIVYRIRRDRASAVQTKEQYMFIYKVVSLYATKLTGGALDSF